MGKENIVKFYLLVAFLAVSVLSAETIGAWRDIRFSGRTAANQSYLRTEINIADSGVNTLIYHNGTVMVEQDQSLLNPASSTYQSLFPVSTSRRYLGLRLATGDNPADLIPVYYEGTALPALSQMTLASADAQNETTYNYGDIVNDYVTFSQTKIYGAIQNRGGGFPLSQSFGTVYPSYFVIIGPPDTNPNDPDAIVWAMVYMNVALGGISPGLYKITGTSTSDLTRIGNISTQIVSGSNLLIMSCDIADLMADADFTSWYNPAQPVLGFLSLTNRTTVIPFATVQMDNSPGAIVYPKPLYFDPANNQTPVLSQSGFHTSANNTWFEVSYSDANANFPLAASVNLSRRQAFPLYPESNNFSLPVVFKTDNLHDSLAEYGYGLGQFSFSDNQIDYSTTELPFTYIRGLLSPANVSCSVNGNLLQINWQPVTCTLEGTPVPVSLYRVEASQSPGFEEFALLGSSSSTSYSIPLNTIAPYGFYRIIAIVE